MSAARDIRYIAYIAYIASDVAEGETLAEFGRRENPRPVKRRWKIFGAGMVAR